MRYIVKINNGLVGIVAEKRKEDAAATGKAEDMMAFIEGKAIENNSIMLTIVYLIMIGQLIVLIGTYYKRAFHIAFLIIIYPIIATYYIWERSKGSGGRKSGSKAYEAWVKEFIVLVFTQLVHAVVYAVLIEGMYDALLTDAGGNYILYILCVTFLFKAEGIAKQIFNVRSTAGTLGDLAQSGAAAFAITKSVTSVFKKADGGASAQDEKEAQETNKQVNTLRNANTANAIRKQVESEEANNRQSQGNAQGAGAGPGGGSGGPSGTSGGLGGGNGNGGPNGPGNVGNTVPVVNMQTIGANQQDQTNVSMQMNGSGVMAPQGNNQNTIQQNTTAQNQKRVAARGQMTDLEKMRLVQRQKALQAKTGGKGRKIAKFAVRNLGRTAGIAAGLALGAAQGNMSSAISNAANFGMIGARLGNGVTRIADVGIGRFAGARMRLKSERGDFKEDFKAAGVSEEFIEEVYNNARGEAIRKALASEASGVRRGGKALGDVKFTGTIERETRS